MCIPSDVAFLPDDRRLVVAEYDTVNGRNNRLELFDRFNGRSLGFLGCRGETMQPLGVAVSCDRQHLAVTDCRAKIVRLVSLATGQSVIDIGKGQFGWPYGVAVTSHGQVLVHLSRQVGYNALRMSAAIIRSPNSPRPTQSQPN